jgi:hypothetical protein
LDRIEAMEEEAVARLQELGFHIRVSGEAQSVVPEQLAKGHLGRSQSKRHLAWWMLKAIVTAPLLRDAYERHDIDRIAMHAMELVTAGLSPEFLRGHKTLISASQGGDERGKPYREQQPKIEKAARDYRRKRPHASDREVGAYLSRHGFGQAETLRKKIAHLKPKNRTRKKTG